MKETIKHPLGKKPFNWQSLVWVLLTWSLFLDLSEGYFHRRLRRAPSLTLNTALATILWAFAE